MGTATSQQERQHWKSLSELMQTFQAVIAFWDREIPLFLRCLSHSVDEKPGDYYLRLVLCERCFSSLDLYM